MPAQKFYSTCLIVACWKGDRRAQDPRVAGDPDWYLKQQIERLNRIPSGLQEAVFVWNNQALPAGAPQDKPWPEGLGRVERCASRWIERPNIGISYGAFSAGYAAVRGKYEYYIFTEDDYIFTSPHWDQKLAAWLDDLGPVTGMLCGLVCPLHVQPGRQPPDTHPGIAIWASPAAALEKVWDRCEGKLPHYENDPASRCDYYLHEVHGQVALGQAFNKCGLRMADIGSKYRIPFHNVQGQIKVYHEEHQEALFMPVQCLA